MQKNIRSPRFAIIAIINFDVRVTCGRRVANRSFKAHAYSRRFYFLVVLDDATRNAKVEYVNLKAFISDKKAAAAAHHVLLWIAANGKICGFYVYKL